MKTAQQIAEMFWLYRTEDHDLKLRMRQIAEIADGDVAIPLPELNAVDRPAVANLTHVGIQHMSQRMSSVQPGVEFTPRKLTKAERDAAEMRTKVVHHWWQADRMPLLDAQAGRYLFAYGTAPGRIDVHLQEERPFLSLPSPLGVYVPRPSQVNDLVPAHGIAARQMDAASILKRWPNNTEVARVLRDSRPGKKRWVLEYADAAEIHLVMCGESNEAKDSQYSIDLAGKPTTLGWAPNRAGVSPWIVPGLVHLNKPQGHFDQLVGAYQAQGLLTALELQQAARSVFQETWVVSRPGENAEVITPADPIRGVVGEIRGGDIQTISPDAQFHTHQAQDRLAESQRVTASIPSDFGGQAASNVRTGRRASQLMDAAVDPSLGEAQTTYAIAKELQIETMAAFDKAYFKKSKSFVLKWKGRQSEQEYVPAKLWETAKCLVSYPVAGTDVNSLAILIGQELGMGLRSKASARRLMPTIDDAEGESDMIVAEKLESVFLESLAGMVADPQSPLQPRQLARLIKMVRDEDVDLIDAFLKVQEEAQAEQAETVEPGTPEAMPGLDGAGAIPPAIAGPAPGQQNLASLMGALRLPERQVTTSSGSRA